MLKMLNNNMCY